MMECTDCGRLVPDPHAPHDCDGSEYLDPEAFGGVQPYHSATVDYITAT